MTADDLQVAVENMEYSKSNADHNFKIYVYDAHDGTDIPIPYGGMEF